MEGEILHGLARRGVVTSASRARLEVASRTDRGVSAVGNALALFTERSGPVLLRALNGLSPEMFFTAASPIPDEFRVRGAVRRVYRYFEPAGSHDIDRWKATARLFVGTVDVRSLGRGVPSHTALWRTVEAVDVERHKELFQIEIRAPSFVWGMVRKIVGALRAVDQGQLSTDELAAALGGKARLTLAMAEPERLLLWEVQYAIPWEVRWDGPNRHQGRWWTVTNETLSMRSALLGALARGVGMSDFSQQSGSGPVT